MTDHRVTDKYSHTLIELIMTIYFKKLNLDNFPAPIDIDDVKGNLRFHYGAIRYYDLADNIHIFRLRKFFKIPPRSIYLVEGRESLPPHVDNGQLSCINYYLHTGGYSTSFWLPKPGARRRTSILYHEDTDTYVENDSDERCFYPEDLELEDSFVAMPGESYLLNVSKIHSVDNPTTPEIRDFIQLQWDMSVEEMITHLELRIDD